MTQAPTGDPRLTGPVGIVGAGLLGTSIGLALSRRGIDVLLSDLNPDNLRTASGLGAGRSWNGEPVQLVVVAVPPDHLGAQITAALESDAVVTDVGSVKSRPLAEVRGQVDAGALRRYVGGHPMAGSERSGPIAASGSLFEGRPWALTPHPDADADAVALVSDLVAVCGASVVTFSPEEHDQAVARTSHLPHLLAALVAARLSDAPPGHLTLSGQGVRDVTRIAAGDPSLWLQIVTANAGALGALLAEVRADLDRLVDAIQQGRPDDVAEILDRGVAGTSAIPGKHGGPAQDVAALFVVVPDRPGALAGLFADAADIGVNIEDLHIEHDPGRPVGLVELTVAASRVDFLKDALEQRGWSTHR